jgi:hypothetical protein
MRGLRLRAVDRQLDSLCRRASRYIHGPAAQEQDSLDFEADRLLRGSHLQGDEHNTSQHGQDAGHEHRQNEGDQPVFPMLQLTTTGRLSGRAAQDTPDLPVRR